MNSIAIVDSGNMSGVPEFYIKSIKNNIKPIIGLGFYFAKDSRFSENDEKYHILLRLHTRSGTIFPSFLGHQLLDKPRAII